MSVSATPGDRCTAHSDCGSEEYCYNAGACSACYDNNVCSIYANSIDGDCSVCDASAPPRATWITSVESTKEWRGITSSSDGTKLAATVFGGNIWTSTDSGATWIEDTSVGSTKHWGSITSSSDGTKLAVVSGGRYDGGGNIWTSTDSGATWIEDTSVGSTKDWFAITSSSDGTKLAAVAWNGNIWTSTDSGATWTEDTSVGSTITSGADASATQPNSIEFFASTDGTCTGTHGDLSSDNSLFRWGASSGSCSSYDSWSPPLPSTWPTKGKYLKFTCSATDVTFYQLCSEGCATSTCVADTFTAPKSEVIGKCMDQANAGYPDYKIYDFVGCDDYSGAGTLSYLASACTVTALLLLV